MSNVTLYLSNFSGRHLPLVSHSGNVNWSAGPPTNMTNGLKYGPIYIKAGSSFSFGLTYELGGDLAVAEGNDNFSIQIYTQDGRLYCHYYTPEGHRLAFKSGGAPSHYQVHVIYE